MSTEVRDSRPFLVSLMTVEAVAMSMLSNAGEHAFFQTTHSN